MAKNPTLTTESRMPIGDGFALRLYTIEGSWDLVGNNSQKSQ